MKTPAQASPTVEEIRELEESDSSDTLRSDSISYNTELIE